MAKRILYTVQYRERLPVPLRWNIWCVCAHEDAAISYAVGVPEDHTQYETRVVDSSGQIVYELWREHRPPCAGG